jgi:hypothetical protein
MPVSLANVSKGFAPEETSQNTKTNKNGKVFKFMAAPDETQLVNVWVQYERGGASQDEPLKE